MQQTEYDPRVGLQRLEAWGRGRDWLGWDPYEGLNARAAAALTLGGRALPRRLLIQAVKRSPVNLRPVLGIRPQHNAKAVALVASGYSHLGADVADEWLERLLALDLRPSPSHSAWGYHFPFQSRVFFYPRLAPNTIATSFAAHALLDRFERVGEQRWLDAAQ